MFEITRSSEGQRLRTNLAEWKLNLLSIDSYGSSIFLASGTDIQLFRLDALDEAPVQVWPHPVTSPLQSTTINAIRTGFLLDQPILVTVDDNGHVVLFFYQHLQDSGLPIRNHERVLDNDGSSSWSIAIHSDPPQVAVGCNDHRIRVWRFLSDNGTMKVSQEWDCIGHSHNIPSVEWSPCGTKLASASIDGTLRVWNGTKTEMILQLGQEDILDWGWSVLFIARLPSCIICLDADDDDDDEEELLVEYSDAEDADGFVSKEDSFCLKGSSWMQDLNRLYASLFRGPRGFLLAQVCLLEPEESAFDYEHEEGEGVEGEEEEEEEEGEEEEDSDYSIDYEQPFIDSAAYFDSVDVSFWPPAEEEEEAIGSSDQDVPDIHWMQRWEPPSTYPSESEASDVVQTDLEVMPASEYGIDQSERLPFQAAEATRMTTIDREASEIATHEEQSLESEMGELEVVGCSLRDIFFFRLSPSSALEQRLSSVVVHGMLFRRQQLHLSPMDPLWFRQRHRQMSHRLFFLRQLRAPHHPRWDWQDCLLAVDQTGRAVLLQWSPRNWHWAPAVWWLEETEEQKGMVAGVDCYPLIHQTTRPAWQVVMVYQRTGMLSIWNLIRTAGGVERSTYRI